MHMGKVNHSISKKSDTSITVICHAMSRTVLYVHNQKIGNPNNDGLMPQPSQWIFLKIQIMCP
jgi:hypothetical protein